MNNLEYYSRQKENWETKELEDLKKEYLIKKLDICKIGDIHRRTPGSIAYRLRIIGIIEDHILANGYTEYRNGELYKQIIEEGKKRKEEKKEVKESRERRERKNTTTSYSNDIAEIKNEIQTLKSDVKEILRLINCLYDFESQTS